MDRGVCLHAQLQQFPDIAANSGARVRFPSHLLRSSSDRGKPVSHAPMRKSPEVGFLNWPTEAVKLFKVTLGQCDAGKLRRTFDCSYAVVSAFDEGRLIALGRAISDGEYQAAIYDVVVRVA